eukprot:g24111.t1
MSYNNESEYRRELAGLVPWCNDETLSLKVGKTKELIINFRKKGGEHAPIYINGTEVERMESVKFLRVTITDNLPWTSHVDVHTNFYKCTIESKLSGCITAWYGNGFAQDRKKLQKVVCTAQTITETNVPSMDFIYTARCRRKAVNIIKDPSHP